ncbi:hypothetical protein J2Z40_002108 [Cytobacillus eiseniae]|uniref:Uncharacterized protein n=1 Tax=Cytobacillus eiseniae TaxID=762947 RepID=A0ABS4RGQ7_9BACI|nr:hypothetical protein [Cytobacillus eiseniae]MBP2241545.1 hypothetical protein [Cytobacillus eiseniae]
MKGINLLLLSFILLICMILTACNEKTAYEIIKSHSEITESDDRIQLELDYEMINHSDENYYFTFGFPSYIQDALITQVGIGELSANSRISGVAVIAVSKDGAEMTEETIEAILNGNLPFVQNILIGKMLSLNESISNH